MFIYLIWKNRQGKTLKSLLAEKKATDIASQMRCMGLTVELQPADIPINDIILK